MKKWWKALFLVSALLFVFAGCANEDDNGGGNTDETGDSGPEKTEETMTAEFVFDSALGVTSADITYGYEGKTDTKTDTKTVTVADNKASLKISDSYKNDSGWFEVKVAAKKTDGTAVEVALDSSTSSAGEGKDYINGSWVKFENGKTATFNYKAPSEESAVLTLTFKEFEIPGGSVTVHYGADSGEYTDATAEVAADGKSATATLLEKYANADGWFNGVTITVKDSAAAEVETTYAKYFKFNAGGMSLAVSRKEESGTDGWTKIVDASEMTFDGNLTEVVSAAKFAEIENITSLKVDVASFAGDGDWWATIDCGTGWSENKKELKTYWVADIGGYSITLTGDDLAAYKAGGLYLAGGAGQSATVTVSYQ